ncbi:MAG: CoA-binding protein [Ignavibacteriales bacterium]|nr:CoA-binding protein [Ignavibacteriales bacterium]
MPIENDKIIKEILEESKTIAVVGASPKPWRDSGRIAEFLSRAGYNVYPVNPNYEEVLGMKCYPDLKSVPVPIDIVDVFRNSSEVGTIVAETIAAGAKTVWLQLGIVNEAAAMEAESAGLNVIMDHCILVDHRRLVR